MQIFLTRGSKSFGTCLLYTSTALTEITPGTTVIIAGNGWVDQGSITRVTLTGGDEQIAAVTEVPFSYEYLFEGGGICPQVI